jgi:UDP-glucose 4-epimerase
MLQGRQTKIFGDGTSTRDYVFVRDVADAFSRSCVPGVGDGFRFNIGTGVQTSVRELHTRVAKAVGVPDEPELATPRLGELQAIALETALARREIGWQPTVTLDEGLGETVAWIRSRVGSPTG